ncbi:MAG: 3-phosphoshikimate 1-carboxyvinyltransferase [Clostridia bacterium]|nr:3-phosphoshikimate 1-carboxyvinyltransferase [Clostridia bacterium]
MTVTIQPSQARGEVFAPPSKSMAHRLLICAALCRGTSRVHGISDCEDVRATLGCLKSLGISFEVSGDCVTVWGRPFSELAPKNPLYAKESGSTLRFFIPLALLTGAEVVFTAERSLLSRPFGVYEMLAEQKGFVFKKNESSITAKGPLHAGEYRVPGNISSQFISGLLFALPLLHGDSRIVITTAVESRSYINLTIKALSEFGVSVCWEDEHTLFIRGDQNYESREISVEGDYSGTAFLEAMNLFSHEIYVKGLDDESLQGDKIYRQYFPMLSQGVPTLHIGDCPDLGPILFAVAAAKHGGVFSGTRRLRIKESDRAEAMAMELRKFGVTVKVHDDSVVVFPTVFHAPSEPLYGHNDHRIVMALSVLLTVTGGSIMGAEAIKKSYPGFFRDLSMLGICLSEKEDETNATD